MLAGPQGGRTVPAMLGDLIPLLLPNPLLAAAAAGVGVAAGATVLPSYAARRTLTRPVAFALPQETTVLAGVLCDLRRYPYLATVSPTDFATSHHHNIWTALRDVLGEYSELPAEPSEEDCARIGADLAAHADSIMDALYDRLGFSAAPDTDRARVTELLMEGTSRGYRSPDAEDRAYADAEVVSAAEALLASGNDRNRMAGSGLVIPSTDPNSLDESFPPLVRSHTPPSTLRRAATAAATGVAAGLIPGFVAMAGFSGFAAAAAGVALVTLLVMSVLVSLVDIDTLYVDVPVWAVGTASAWASTAAAAAASGDSSRLLIGAVMVAAVAALFEGTNWVFRMLRGMDGQGFGDTLIILATVGVPPALTGDWRVGYWSVMAGLLAGAAGWVVARVAGKVTRSTPFAFGPWLAAGWVLALCWYAFDTAYIGFLT